MLQRTATRGTVRLAALALLLLLTLSLAIPTRAATGGAGEDVTALMATVSDLTPLEETLYRGLVREEEQIDLSGVTPAPTVDDVRLAMQHLINAAPELFHVGTGYTTSGYGGGSVVSLTPTYTLTGRELLTARLE